MEARLRYCLIGVLVSGSLALRTLHAQNKNGVSPQVISLPSGPGSIQGLGESFQPQLNTGGGSYAITIQVPSGPAEHKPTLTLQYHSGQGNGCVGIGWRLSGPTAISRNTDDGIPLYVDAANGVDDDFDGTTDNPEELDRFSGFDMEELVLLSNGTFRGETEGGFIRYERKGTGGWLARAKDGTQFEFGTDASTRIEKDGREFSWLLRRVTDLNGNETQYHYATHPDSPGQKYCSEIRWARPDKFYAAVLSYDAARPDVYSDFRSGFEVRTGLRLSRIDVVAQGVPPSPGALQGDFNEDGVADSLIRRYELEYHENEAVSLLRQVTLFGSDGVTALPPNTFEYTFWEPITNVSTLTTLSSNDPLVVLDNANVELIDMNQDGLPDLLEATQAGHRAYLNLGLDDTGRLAWDAVGAPVVNAPSLDLGSTAAHLADHTANGLADLIHKVSDSTFQCFINTGRKEWTDPAPLTVTDSFPLWPFEDVRSRTLDLDHNRLHDILHTGDSSMRLWMLLRGGRYAREVAVPVLSDGSQTFRFDAPGARIADANGDRISDLVWVQSTRVVYWASCGRGNFEGPNFLPLGTSLSSDEISRADFADVNADAVPDLVVVRPAVSPNGVHYWLNLGHVGFDVRRVIEGLPSAQSGDATRCADMNGNGSVDLVLANSARQNGRRIQFLEFAPGVRPHLLIRVDNGHGLVTTMDYESSVDQMVHAERTALPWDSTMPISIPVLARITEDDSHGHLYVRDIKYRDPYYDPEKQEFRGFAQAEVLELGDASIPSSISISQFDTGASNGCLKGVLIAQEVRSENGTLFVRTEQSWQTRVLESGADGRDICYPIMEAVDTHVFEGSPSAVRLRTEYVYDDFGNVLQENNLGIADTSGDEVFVDRAFDYKESSWLLNRVARMTKTDGQGAKAAEESYTYDPRGNLLTIRRWLDSEDRLITSVRNEYDEFGNVVTITNANGNRRTVEYDALVHAYPVAELVHLAKRILTVRADYDFGYGTVIRSTDAAGANTTYGYDALGRLTTVLAPGGAETLYTYLLGAPVSSVITRRRENLAGDTFDSHAYFDGYGRSLGSKLETENDEWRFLDAVNYNRRKQEHERWLPYHTPTPAYETPDPTAAHMTQFYDETGRTVRIVNPDGTFATSIYEPLIRRDFDENDNAGAGTPITRRFDGLERLVELVERNANVVHETRFTWTTLGDLTETVDAHNNVKRSTFDSLRRKTMLHDPDRGVMLFEYDDVGNLIKTTDANAQVTLFDFDRANRLIGENYLDQGGGPADPIDVEYRYDVPGENIDQGDGTTATATFTIGRLSSVRDLSGEQHFSYDGRGNAIWNVKRIQDPLLDVSVSFRMGFDYDLLDRMTDVYYPDNDHVQYAYNAASLVERVSGGPGGSVIVSNVDYEATGQILRMVMGNDVISSYRYDARNRMTESRTVSPVGDNLLHYEYEFDQVSNITRIHDRRPFAGQSGVPADSRRRNTQLYQYDDLYRLTQVKYSPLADGVPTHGQVDYTYDKIGNMLTKTTPPAGSPGHISDARVHLGTMTVGGLAGTMSRAGRLPGDAPGPHALTATDTGRQYEYDDNGNMSSMNGAALTWDFKDRLIRFENGAVSARYTYDHADRRTSSLVTSDEAVKRTLYINRFFEVRPNHAPVKYVFSGTTRLARVKGVMDPSRRRLQRLWLTGDWNLMSLAVQSTETIADIFGSDVQVYQWTGSTYQPLDLNTPPPAEESLWVFAPSTRAVHVLGSDQGTTGPREFAPGQHLVAWSRPEALIPSVHVSGQYRIHAFESSASRWHVVDALLPQGITTHRSSFDAMSSFWLMLDEPAFVDESALDVQDVLFFHTDHLGSNHVITNAIGTLVQESALYPFGLPRSVHAGDHPTHSSGEFLFTDKELDDESGLYYFGARFHDPVTGRFVSTDPLELEHRAQAPAGVRPPAKLHLYAYSGNNPVNNLDPDGRDFEVRGPRARQFVDLVSEYSGVPLLLDDEKVTVDPDGAIDPFASPTLQKLVFDTISSDNQVRIAAFGGKNPGFFGDSFFGQPGTYPARSVFVRDLTDIESHSPILARGVLGHILGEYFSAARPAGAKRTKSFSRNHIAGLRAEGAVVGELTGREVHSGKKRPWEQFDSGKNIALRAYGPNLRYRIVLYPGTTLIKGVIPPKGIKE